MVRVSVLNDALKTMYNAEKRGKRQVLLRPSSKVVIKFLQVMQRHGEPLPPPPTTSMLPPSGTLVQRRIARIPRQRVLLNTGCTVSGGVEPTNLRASNSTRGSTPPARSANSLAQRIASTRTPTQD